MLLLSPEKTSLVVVDMINQQEVGTSTSLKELEIDIYQGAPGTVAENIQQFIDEKLAKLEEATGPIGIESKS